MLIDQRILGAIKSNAVGYVSLLKDAVYSDAIIARGNSKLFNEDGR